MTAENCNMGADGWKIKTLGHINLRDNENVSVCKATTRSCCPESYYDGLPGEWELDGKLMQARIEIEQGLWKDVSHFLNREVGDPPQNTLEQKITEILKTDVCKQNLECQTRANFLDVLRVLNKYQKTFQTYNIKAAKCYNLVLQQKRSMRCAVCDLSYSKNFLMEDLAGVKLLKNRSQINQQSCETLIKDCVDAKYYESEYLYNSLINMLSLVDAVQLNKNDPNDKMPQDIWNYYVENALDMPNEARKVEFARIATEIVIDNWLIEKKNGNGMKMMTRYIERKKLPKAEFDELWKVINNVLDGEGYTFEDGRTYQITTANGLSAITSTFSTISQATAVIVKQELVTENNNQRWKAKKVADGYQLVSQEPPTTIVTVMAYGRQWLPAGDLTTNGAIATGNGIEASDKVWNYVRGNNLECFGNNEAATAPQVDGQTIKVAMKDQTQFPSQNWHIMFDKVTRRSVADKTLILSWVDSARASENKEIQPINNADYIPTEWLGPEDGAACWENWNMYGEVGRSLSCIHMCETLMDQIISPKPFSLDEKLFNALELIYNNLGQKEDVDELKEKRKQAAELDKRLQKDWSKYNWESYYFSIKGLDLDKFKKDNDNGLRSFVIEAPLLEATGFTIRNIEIMALLAIFLIFN